MGGTLPLGFSAVGGVGVAVGFWRWSELLHLWQVSAGEDTEHLGLLGVGCSLRLGSLLPVSWKGFTQKLENNERLS